jgi:RNA polymerase sigma factor (sigma-70 family)
LEKEAALIKKLKDTTLKDIAFSELLDGYQERLYWHIRKIVITHENAGDVLQNTFIRVYKSIANFQEKSSLHTWMYRIAYNESLRFLEKNNKKVHENIDGDEIQIKLNTIIASFTEKQKRIFHMKYFDDLSFREISEVLKISESTLKSAYYTAVKIIEEKIIL